MVEQQAFMKLREILAYLYEDETSARRVARDVGLDVAQIPIANRAIDNWNNILLQAQKEGKTASLMANTFREYKENEIFAKAWHDYLIDAGKGSVNTLVYPLIHVHQRRVLILLGVVGTILLVLVVMFLGSSIQQFFRSPFAIFTNALPTVAPTMLADTPVPPTPLSIDDWQGEWDLQWNYEGIWDRSIMILVSDQVGIEGTYKVGTLKGTFVSDDISRVNGEYINTAGTGANCPDGRQTGSFSLNLSNDGKHMDGYWDLCGGNTHYEWKADKRD